MACEFCETETNVHNNWCITKNSDVLYAYTIANQENATIKPEDEIYLRGLGVIWHTKDNHATAKATGDS